MNKWLLQFFLLIAFIPLAILIGYWLIVLAPIFCSFLAINSYRFNNDREMYLWLIIGVISFIISLYMLGIL